MLVTSLGAGLLMPFVNIFFRVAHAQSDATIGSLFAWGSLAMGIGLLISPPLADRWGKIQVVVVSQSLSIPFLVLLGFSPLYWISATAYLARLALMNMSWPIYDAFVMEHAEPEARATVASLVSMSWNFGWAFSPTLSGWLQVNYGFNPVFLGTITAYILAISLYWRFFLQENDTLQMQEAIARDEGLGTRDQ
jgi:MFS family permease